MEDTELSAGNDNIITEFNTYEDFLDSQITSLDLYYLEVSFLSSRYLFLIFLKMITINYDYIKKL